jgi:hypothetical protein
MLPLLSLHALAAQRGDGLRPELKALLERHAEGAAGLTARIEDVDETEILSHAASIDTGLPVTEAGTDDTSANGSCR